MAIDTAEKRRSISGIPFGIPGVTSNALKDAEWRQQVGWSYSGIAIVVGDIFDGAIAATALWQNRILGNALWQNKIAAAAKWQNKITAIVTLQLKK